MKNAFAYISIFLCCLGSGAPLIAQTLSFRNFSVNNGLANSTVYYIHQDSKGFIWLATESGVNRYDGANIETFTMDDGLSDNEVLQIHEDSRGRIWFLTLNGKLSYFYKNKFYNAGNDPVLGRTFCKASFVSFFEDSRHRLWFSTNQRELVMIDAKNVKIMYSATGLFTNSFIAETENKEILILNKNSICRLVGNEFVEIKAKHYPLSSKTVLYNKQKNQLSFISKGGLVELRNGNWVLTRKIANEVSKHGISNFFYDADERLWINTIANGAYVLDTQGTKPFKQFLSGKYITHSLLDTEGNTWISTVGNGVYMLPQFAKNMHHLTASNNLVYSSVFSLSKIPGQGLVLGLKDGNLALASAGKITHKGLNNSQAAYNPIRRLVYDHQNKSIWFASNNTLGEIYPGGEKVRYLSERDNLSYSLKSFSISKSGKLAIALAGGVDILNNKNAPLIFESPNLTNPAQHFASRAYSVFYDSKERLWFANINGLHCFFNNKLVRLYESIPLLSQRVTDITELPDNTILCASYGFGVFILKDFKLVKTITTKTGLASNICKKIFYSKNYIWVITGKGLSRISADLKEIDNFNKENGLLSNEINDAIVDNDTLYAASNSGLSIFRSDIRQEAKKEIPLNLNYVLVDNKKIVPGNKFVLSHKDNNLTVSFIGIDFNNPGQISYRYRLKNDENWNVTTNNIIEFGSLETGEYNLQIKAKGLNSGWSKPIILAFEIKPPVWKTTWFIVLLSIAVIPATFLLINHFYKRKRIKEQEKLLAKTKIIALEQQALQAMMNPHFIFNVMNSIQHFINTKDTVMANQLLTGFARLIRKNLDICNKSYISIDEELSYLTLYLSLEKLRFGEKMNYIIDVEEGIDKEETLIPSMLLQPFVENAIWHGIMPKETNGNIKIAIKLLHETYLYISIEDDGIGIDNSIKSKSSDHISRGMELTRERISLLNKFDAPIELNVQNVQPHGTKVTIQLPI